VIRWAEGGEGGGVTGLGRGCGVDLGGSAVLKVLRVHQLVVSGGSLALGGARSAWDERLDIPQHSARLCVLQFDSTEVEYWDVILRLICGTR